MGVIITPVRDDGGHVPTTELIDQVLTVAPDAVCRLVKGPIQGVEVDDAAAVRYLMTMYTASGRKRKG